MFKPFLCFLDVIAKTFPRERLAGACEIARVLLGLLAAHKGPSCCLGVFEDSGLDGFVF